MRLSELSSRGGRNPLRGIVAALGGIAIAIKHPSRSNVPDPKKYFNRKRFFARCVQVAVGAEYKFLCVSATHAGSTHDSAVFASSSLSSSLEKSHEDGWMPNWGSVASDEAYGNDDRRILNPYSATSLPS